MAKEREMELERMLSLEKRKTKAEFLAEEIRNNMNIFIDLGWSEDQAFRIAMALLMRGGGY